MKIKRLIARWIAIRTENQTRTLRRALRDHQRLELARIHEQEKRTRGLRLYAAWSQPRLPANVIRRVSPGWDNPVARAA